jgi:hypothetical protein
MYVDEIQYNYEQICRKLNRKVEVNPYLPLYLFYLIYRTPPKLFRMSFKFDFQLVSHSKRYLGNAC